MTAILMSSVWSEYEYCSQIDKYLLRRKGEGYPNETATPSNFIDCVRVAELVFSK